MQLSIIIVSFNTRELLKQCLESLSNNYGQEIKNQQFEVIVVDNASRDESVSFLKKNFPYIKTFVNEKNEGFAKASNIGVRLACGQYILLLNPDTVIPNLTLTTLIDYLNKNAHVGIVTCKVVLQNGKLDDACHRGFPTPLRALFHFTGLASLFPHSHFFNGYHLGYKSMNKVHEIEACVGAFLMIKKTVGDEIGWLDEDYFWYGEDLDLCFRVKKKGYKVIFIPYVSIVHLKGAASGLTKHSQQLTHADKQTRLVATKARFEVMRIFYQKHYLNLYPSWLTQLVLLGISLRQKLAEISL